MDYEVEGARPRGHPKRTVVVEKDCQIQQTCKEGAIDVKK